MARIEIILGPMFSGKSTELIRRCSRYEAIGKKVQIFNHAIDTRCGDDEISTHSHSTLRTKATKLTKLLSAKLDPMPDDIGIDEAQFFEDLFDFVQFVEKYDVVVIIAGLDGDYMRRPFGQILRCVPYCDEVVKLTAMCSATKDGTLGIFTKKITEQDIDVVSVGAGEKFAAMCRAKYLE
mgnify:CR=1 FL=1